MSTNQRHHGHEAEEDHRKGTQVMSTNQCQMKLAGMIPNVASIMLVAT
jgi:hypothetical protein